MAHQIRPPSRLFDPHENVVPFVSVPEHDVLRSWARQPGDTASVLVLSGTSGSGKTRLALHIAADQGINRDALTVIDGAIARSDEITALVEAASSEAGPRLRLVLVAGHHGELDAILGDLGPTITDVRYCDLPATPGEEVAEQLARAAYAAFRQAVGSPPADPPPGLLELCAEEPTMAEVCHLALDAAYADPFSWEPPEDLYDALKNREFEHWRESVADRELGFANDEITLAQSLALPTLVAARDRAALGAALSGLPGFRSRGYDVRGTVDLLTERWPKYPDQPWLLAEFKPEVVPDRVLRSTLLAYGEPDRGADVLVDALGGIAPSDLPGALTTVARIGGMGYDVLAQDDTAALAVGSALTRIMAAAPDRYLPPLCAVARAVMDTLPLHSLLVEGFRAASGAVAVAAYLGLPRHQRSLASTAGQIGLELAQRGSADAAEPLEERPQAAALHLDLADRMIPANLLDEAAAHAQRAVELAAAGTDRRLHAQSLCVFATAVGRLGHADYACELADDALKIARALGDEQLLKHALQQVVMSRHMAGESQRAVPAVTELLELLPGRPGGSDIDALESRAGTLAIASLVLGDTGDLERSAEFAGQAAELSRDLAARYPGSHLERYVVSLDTYGIALARAGREDEAYLVTEQALVLIEDLDQREPETHRYLTAQVRANFGNRLALRGDLANAVQAFTMAAATLAELFQRSPQFYGPKLGIALWGLANVQRDMERWDDALRTGELLATVQRSCVHEGQPWVIPDLLDSLSFLRSCLVSLKRFDRLPELDAEHHALESFFTSYRQDG